MDSTSLFPCFTGTAGWSHPHWNSVVYPRPRPRGFHPLKFLSRYFDVVEINTSFYQLLRPEVVRLWLRQTEDNPGFRFTAKLNRRFTHDRILQASDVSAFKQGLWPLMRARRLATLLMQFPWTFRFTTENREFLIQLRRAFHEFPLVAEMRHSSWLADEALGTFIDHRIGFCNLDQAQQTRTMPATSLLTSSIAYVRLHGRGADSDRECSYLYSPAELGEWIPRIEYLRRYAAQTIVIFTNDAGGRSFANALQMQSALADRTPAAVPAELLRRYPAALTGFRPDRPLQPALFGERAVA